ncbi:retrotransposon protein, putative, ty1-copia subclass [Tanacetum coccineum]
MVNEMLISSGLSQDMWGEAILTTTYLLNKIPRKEKEETPDELWMGRKPSYQYLQNSSAYRFIIHDSKNPDIQKNAVMESRNASFFENIFPCLTKETGSSSRLDEEVVQDKRQRDDNDLQDKRQDQTEEEEVEPRRSKRARNEKSFGPDFVSFMVENEPTSYREADELEHVGRRLKERNVVVDVVSFANKDQEFDVYKTESLKAFVAAADKDKNSHFAHVPHHSSDRDILMSSNILSPSEAEAVPLTE